MTCLWCKSEKNISSPSSLNVDGKDKGCDYPLKGMKSHGQLNEDGRGMNTAETISLIFEFVSSVVPFFMKIRSMIKISDIG
jgi:hypothetical protein